MKNLWSNGLKQPLTYILLHTNVVFTWSLELILSPASDTFAANPGINSRTSLSSEVTSRIEN